MIDISVTDLVKSFDLEKKILDGVSFQIDTGERVGLLGKNGAGKSTLFNILTGELDYDSGQVLIAPGRRVGLISQIPVYPEGYTVEDVLRSAFQRTTALKEEMDRLTRQMEQGDSDPQTLRRYGELTARFEGLGDPGGLLRVPHQGAAVAVGDDLPHRAAHVDVDQVRPGDLRRDTRRLRHAHGVAAENLGAGRVLPGGQLQQAPAFFVLIAQGLGADHLRDRQARPQLPADQPEGQVRHPRHGGQHQPRGNFHRSDFHAAALLSGIFRPVYHRLLQKGSLSCFFPGFMLQSRQSDDYGGVSMPMKCPFCGEEMTPGVIQSRDGVYWSREAGAVAALAGLKKDAITLADSGSSVFGGAAAEAFNCPRCKKIILDYSVRHLPL